MLNKHTLPYFVSLGLFVLSTNPAIAQPITPADSQQQDIFTSVLFTPPEDDKKPDTTRGGASRNGLKCIQDVDSPTPVLNPLVPPFYPSGMETALEKPMYPNYHGLTEAEHPTIWLMIGETAARKIVLSIEDERGVYHSQTIIPISGQSSLISLQPSEDAPSLAVGNTYKLGIVLVCGQNPTPNDPSVAVWVSRVNVSLPANLQSTLDKAAWYGKQGIWYDALTFLAQEKQLYPNDPNLNLIWHQFLKSGGLQDLTTEKRPSEVSNGQFND